MPQESTRPTSRIPNFYRLSVDDRLRVIHERGMLSGEDTEALSSGEHTLTIGGADKMIENVIGVLGLPVGLGLNFLINSHDYVIPLAVEEPSIVAALSSAAKLVRAAGGFAATSSEPILIGQVQVMDVPHPAKARNMLLQHKSQILNLANSLHPKMVARGGGARDLEVFLHPGQGSGGDMLVVHLLVDTCDAMGANLVNTMCEGIARLVERYSGGKVFLRILSNLTDHSLVRAKAVIPVNLLGNGRYDGEQVRDGIIIASEFAAIDPYRAATHNKGIMNGIDAVTLATGNDWRAIEAGAHAYAARGSRYTSLSRFYRNNNGDLVGELEIPIKVGTVGGPLQSNPTVALNLRLLGVKSARELAEVMGAVGLGQNLAALRALATDGIQKGHMSLHARSVAMAAGTPPEIFNSVVNDLIEEGEIKIWKARELVRQAQTSHARGNGKDVTETQAEGTGHGKVVLLGEHAVVYGRHAIAAPIPLAITARVTDGGNGVHIVIPKWGVEHTLESDPERRRSFERPAGQLLDALGLVDKDISIEVYPRLPRAMGLGASAAVAVAIIRALDAHFSLDLSDSEVNELALEGEKLAHGNPSGVDNAIATHGRMMLFKRGNPPEVTPLSPPRPLTLVVAMSGIESLTAETVARVRRMWERNPTPYENIFDQIDALTLKSLKALQSDDLEQLGDYMNVCHGLLNALRVSTWELEEMVQVARDNGALGAKLTGGGGGGSIIALCEKSGSELIDAFDDAGYQAVEVQIG
ncbi:MAG: hydroxymethylglutaryl-CoA reductase, degradative [Woeseia sp.]